MGYDNLANAPSRPDRSLPPSTAKPRPGWRTVLAAGMALAATVMTLPAAATIERGSRAGRYLTKSALGIAIIGSCLWSWPILVQAGNGL
jgi:hypothetical protein